MSGWTKGEIVEEIARMLGVATPPMSTGSTEPKAIFELVNRELGLGLHPGLGKPQLAKAIVESAGFDWTPDCESRGATVTTAGLEAVAAAVRLFLE